MSARILITEDELVVAEDLRRKLVVMGHHVVGSAGSGEEAVQMTRELKPDLVLMDIRLRGRIDGIEAAFWISELTSTPIIYITAYTHRFFERPDAMRAPGICLAKPFTTTDLQTAIDVTLAEPESGSQRPPEPLLP